MDDDSAKRAKLVKAEVVGLRLYTGMVCLSIRRSESLFDTRTRFLVTCARLCTGPAYKRLNDSLREALRIRSSDAGKNACGEFKATCSAINSGLKKLARVTPLAIDRLLYRGLSDRAFDQKLLTADGKCVTKCFVDAGFSSATPNLKTALSYAGEKSSTILKIQTGGIDRGAQVSWISQFPDEEEHTILPLSAYEVVEMRAVSKEDLLLEANGKKQHVFNRATAHNRDSFDGKVNVLTVKLNLNLKAQTSQERLESRRSCVFDLFQSLRLEVNILKSQKTGFSLYFFKN